MPPTIRVVVPTRMSGTGRAGLAEASQMIPPRQVSKAAPRIERTTFVVLIELKVVVPAAVPTDFRAVLRVALLVVDMASPWGVGASTQEERPRSRPDTPRRAQKWYGSRRECRLIWFQSPM